MTNIIKCINKSALGDELTAYVLDIAKQAIEARGRFTVALSGGSLPTLLATKRLLDEGKGDASKWHCFFADERYVEESSADSNCGACKSALLDALGVPDAQIYKLAYEEAKTDGHIAEDQVRRAAVAYEQRVRDLFGVSEEESTSERVPAFDLILLGMGPDGHTASLFPNHPLADVGHATNSATAAPPLIAHIVDSPKPPPQRITFTLPLINAAHNVAFVCAGASKKESLHRALSDDDEMRNSVPSGRVRPKSGTLRWFIDEEAWSG